MHIALVVVVAVFAVGVASCAPSGAEAQAVTPAASATPSDVEAEALAAWHEGRALTARRLAQEALAADPDSMIGHYVKGASLRASDGALAPALHHLARARERYESTWTLAPRPPDAPWDLHRAMLFEIQEIAQELGAHHYRLEVIEFHDALYEPDLGAQRAWTLMQLGDLDAARVYARIEAQAHDPNTRSLGLNALCAIETVSGDRDARFEACVRALQFASERADRADSDTGTVTGVNVAVHAFNASLAAMAAGRSDAAERFAAIGAARLAPTPANPWRWRVRRWLAQGRTLDVAGAVQAMDRWRRRQPAWLRAHDRAATSAAWARVLLIAGDLTAARAAIDRAIAHPDRHGLSSLDSAQSIGAHAVLRASILRAALHRDSEHRACGLPSDGRFEARMTLALDRERIVGALLDDVRLIGTFRPWHGSGLDLDAWQLGDLVWLLGAGVVDRAVGLAVGREVDARFAPWTYAVLAEASLARGDSGRARAFASEALATLPEGERLVRARLELVRGTAAQDLGDLAGAESSFAVAMVDDPGVVRRLGFALPVRIEVGTDSLASAVALRLAGSPRFDVRDNARLRLTVEASDSGGVEACLHTEAGARITCVRSADGSGSGTTDAQILQTDARSDTATDTRGTEPDVVACAEIHDALFAAPLQLETIDRSSLDGRTTVDEAAARDALRDAIDAAMQGR